MKHLILIMVISILIISCGGEKIIRNDDIQFIDRYIQLGESLFKDNGTKTSFVAKKAVQDLEKVMEKMLEMNEKSGNDNMKKIISLFKAISSTKDISKQREIYNELSVLAKEAAVRVDKTLYLQYCPMAFDDQGAEWISDKKEINNPYFGPEMPKCGTTKEVFNEK